MEGALQLVQLENKAEQEKQNLAQPMQQWVGGVLHLVQLEEEKEELLLQAKQKLPQPMQQGLEREVQLVQLEDQKEELPLQAKQKLPQPNQHLPWLPGVEQLGHGS